MKKGIFERDKEDGKSKGKRVCDEYLSIGELCDGENGILEGGGGKNYSFGMITPLCCGYRCFVGQHT